MGHILTSLLLATMVWLAQFADARAQNAAATPSSKTAVTTDQYEAAIASLGKQTDFRAFLSKLPQFDLDDYTGTTRRYYLLEDDLVATADQVWARLNELQSLNEDQKKPKEKQKPPASPGELLVMKDAYGQPVFWASGKRNLSYAIDRKTFNEADYQVVVQAMKEAASAWVDACRECGLTFEHASQYDSASPSAEVVTFVVTYSAQEARFIAAAFFPNDPVYRRYLVIGPQFFATSFSRVGVLRHELGHILGYRHMHIVGVPGCNLEDNNWLAITAKYDRLSVMHYYCGGGGTRSLELSDQDKADHRKLYMSDR